MEQKCILSVLYTVVAVSNNYKKINKFNNYNYILYTDDINTMPPRQICSKNLSTFRLVLISLFLCVIITSYFSSYKFRSTYSGIPRTKSSVNNISIARSKYIAEVKSIKGGKINDIHNNNQSVSIAIKNGAMSDNKSNIQNGSSDGNQLYDGRFEKQNGKRESFASLANVPQFHVKEVNCRKVIENNTEEIENANKKEHLDTDPKDLELELHTLSQNCDNFLSKRQYILNPVNQEEADFPIAFSIIMFKESFMVERLLRSIYRPQNVYCIHVDATSSNMTHSIMNNIASCLPNVFIASQHIDVKWGWFSIGKADLVCLEDLLNHPVQWSYFVNLCGQEFPIKTNLELVRVLKAYNGANDIQGRYVKKNAQVLQRIKYGHKNESRHSEKYLKPPFQYNITWVKGAVHAAITRGFAEFMIHSEIGKAFVEYISDTSHGSEHLWNPIHFSPQLGAPGSYTGYPNISSDPIGQSMIRYKIWGNASKRLLKYKCKGKFSKDICIFAPGDLHAMVNSGRLFANKFHSDYQPLAYDCLEEYVWNNTRLDIMGVDRLNISFYENLDFVKHHI